MYNVNDKIMKFITKASNGIDWLLNDLWHGPAKLDYTVSEDVQNIRQNHEIHHESHKKLKSGINSRKKKTLVKVKIHGSIFQEDSLSQLLFIIPMMPLSYILKKSIGGCKFTKSQEKINHPMYKDVKLFAKNEKRIVNPDTNNKNIQPGMKFSIKK